VAWEAAPAGTRSYAIIADDWDVPSPLFPVAHFTHWILYDIPPDAQHIDGLTSDSELKQLGISLGENSDGARGYRPPCPPFGKHHYVFRVYALDVPTVHPGGSGRLQLLAAMKGHVLAYGELVGQFGR
jgi:Raf kinase inhibitor-like YbhB/YbcL family protein